MAIKSRNKVDATFNMSSMTDIVFLLLIFFMITSTLVHPTALKLVLPSSGHQTDAKPQLHVFIESNLQYSIQADDKFQKINREDLEGILQQYYSNDPDLYISLNAEKTVAIEHVVHVMDIAKTNGYKLILKTSPVKRK